MHHPHVILSEFHESNGTRCHYHELLLHEAVNEPTCIQRVVASTSRPYVEHLLLDSLGHVDLGGELILQTNVLLLACVCAASQSEKKNHFHPGPKIQCTADHATLQNAHRDLTLSGYMWDCIWILANRTSIHGLLESTPGKQTHDEPVRSSKNEEPNVSCLDALSKHKGLPPSCEVHSPIDVFNRDCVWQHRVSD